MPAAVQQAWRLYEEHDELESCIGYTSAKAIHSRMQDTDYFVKVLMESGITNSQQMTDLAQRRRDLIHLRRKLLD